MAALTLRTAAAKARAAASSTNAEDDAEQATSDTLKTSVAASSDARIGVEQGDGAHHMKSLPRPGNAFPSGG